MLALKGEAAATELERVAPSLKALGAVEWGVVSVGAELGDAATRVVRIDLGANGFRPGKAARPSKSARSPRSRRTPN
jgi:hypothetical protein